jgi:hypothetical protein
MGVTLGCTINRVCSETAVIDNLFGENCSARVKNDGLEAVHLRIVTPSVNTNGRFFILDKVA